MADETAQRGLTRLLARTARAHHEATGGANHEWAQWYAEHLVGAIDEFVGFSPSVDTVKEWLVASDARQLAEDPDGHWPSAYARYILEDLASG